MKTVILDTNFIISTLKNKINLNLDKIITSSYQLKIIDKTIDELEKINNKESKLAIKIIEKNKIKKIKTKGKDVDWEIVKNSNKNTIVATLDKELKQRLKNKNIPIITIRQKRYFKME